MERPHDQATSRIANPVSRLRSPWFRYNRSNFINFA
jgi:hypothetical protein